MPGAGKKNPAGRDFLFFHHLLDTDAELVAPGGNVLAAYGAFYVFKAVFDLVLFYDVAGNQTAGSA